MRKGEGNVTEIAKALPPPPPPGKAPIPEPAMRRLSEALREESAVLSEADDVFAREVADALRKRAATQHEARARTTHVVKREAQDLGLEVPEGPGWLWGVEPASGETPATLTIMPKGPK
jgi:hypothetical protein